MIILLKNLLAKLILNKYFVYFVLISAIALGAYFLHRNIVSNEVDLARNELISKYDKALQEEKNKANEIQSKLLQDTIDELAIKNEKIKNLNRELDSILTSLQYRNGRSNGSETSEVAGTCTGAGLFREDGEFLAREASRADRILAERNFYYERYESARKELEALRNQSNK